MGIATEHAIRKRVENGETFGLALVHQKVPAALRKKLLGIYLSEDLADGLDRHYELDAAGDHAGALVA